MRAAPMRCPRAIRSLLISAALLLDVVAAHRAAVAQGYPAHPIKLIVPFAAGGPTDVTGRILADVLSRKLGRPIVVENFGGAGGNVGAERAAHAQPDGYTLLFTNISMAISPALYPNLAYDPLRDFIGLGIAVFSPTMLVARPSFAKVPFKDFIDYLRSNGSKVNAANTGPGGPSFLCESLLMRQLKTRFNMIPYQGTGPALIDVAAGRADIVCDAVITASVQSKAGRVKAYGIVGDTRAELLPDLADSGRTGPAQCRHAGMECLVCADRHVGADRRAIEWSPARRTERSGFSAPGRGGRAGDRAARARHAGGRPQFLAGRNCQVDATAQGDAPSK